MTQEYDIAFTCSFCGHKWTDKYPVRGIEHKTLSGCRLCTVPVDARKGTKIRYGAWARCPADAVYADQNLERGAVYTIARIKRWQHGANVELQETNLQGSHIKVGSNRSFNLRLFVPEGFEKLGGAEPDHGDKP